MVAMELLVTGVVTVNIPLEMVRKWLLSFIPA
jgi:hypothetical protein